MSFCSNCRHKLGLASLFKIKADGLNNYNSSHSTHFMKERLLLFIKCTEKDFGRFDFMEKIK